MNADDRLVSRRHSRVAVLVTVHTPVPSPFEEVSLRQCGRVLASHRIVLICPRGMDTERYEALMPGVEILQVHPRWQGTYRMYNRLKIAPLLYRAFRDHEYVLFHEPDAFVFRDELNAWADRSYSLIGAPWLEGFGAADPDARLIGVGNGGLCLRRTADHLRVLRSFRFIENTWAHYRRRNLLGKIHGLPGLLADCTFRNNTCWLFNTWGGNEDVFWSRRVAPKFDWYTVPDPLEASRFSIEVQPAAVVRRNGGQLPMGCHAWWRHDLAFWRPHIEECIGGPLPAGGPHA